MYIVFTFAVDVWEAAVHADGERAWGEHVQLEWLICGRGGRPGRRGRRERCRQVGEGRREEKVRGGAPQGLFWHVGRANSVNILNVIGSDLIIISLDLKADDRIDLETLRIFLVHSLTVSCHYWLPSLFRWKWRDTSHSLRNYCWRTLRLRKCIRVLNKYRFECFKLMMIYSMTEFVTTPIQPTIREALIDDIIIEDLFQGHSSYSQNIRSYQH